MIITKLLPHQKYLLDLALKKGNRVALWADAGVGKSLVALAYAEAIDAKRILVTCDRQNIDRTWPVEVQTHTDFDLHRPESGRYQLGDKRQVTLASHDWLKFHVDGVNACGPYDFWIGDESADYKNPRTLRMTGLRQVLERIPKRMIVSAFPVSEKLEDAFGQMLCLDDGDSLGRYITHFRKRFMLPDPCSAWGWVPKADAVDRIRKIVQPFLVALPDDVKPTMPERIFETLYVPLYPGTKPVYDKLKSEFTVNVLGSQMDLTQASSQFTKLFELCGGFVYTDDEARTEKAYGRFDSYKIDAVKQLADQFKDKFVVWTHFRAEQDILANELDVPCWIYRGGKSGLEPFKRHTGKSCLLISCQYAKGLNDLVDVHDVIFYSMPWAYITLAQAEMRTCRITGKGPTRYYRIVVQDTVDEKIYNLVMAKAEFTSTVDGFRAMVD